jgi:hypothetical protein
MARRKPPASPKEWGFKVIDCGGYWQVYYHDEYAESKLANIYPPGFEQFGKGFDAVYYTTDILGDIEPASDFQRALERVMNVVLDKRREWR